MPKKLLAIILILVMLPGNTFADFTIQAGETFALSAGEAFSVDGGIAIAGTGALDASAAATSIFLTGDWANSGLFSAGNGTVTFEGAGISNISGNNNFYNFTSETASKQLTFEANSIQAVANLLTLDGQALGTEIKLRSSITGTRWTFNVTAGAQSVDWVDVEDSNASSNNIIAYNAINSGNNDDTEPAPHWIFGAPIYISSPATTQTVGQRPTIIGYTVDPNTAFTIRGVSGSATVVVATGTSDANGNFRLVVAAATPLDLGANSLTPYVGANPGITTNLIVAASPTTAEVPTITSPIEASAITSNPFTITGFASPATQVRAQAINSSGNLVLNVGATISDPVTGAYSISCDAIAYALAAGANILSVTTYTILGSAMTTSGLINITFADPFGIVFDSSSNNPVGNAVVSLYYDNDPGAARDWILAVPGVQIGAADINPQTTGASGFYSYNCIDGDFYINISAANYDYPSAKTSFPAGRTVITGSKQEPFTVAGAIIQMDHPMDPSANLIKIEKSANKSEARIGDIVTYTVSLKNTSSSDVSNILLEDKIPAGFKYLSGKVILDNLSIADPSGGRPLDFDIGTIASGQTKILKYQLIVGAGVTFGNYENRAHAKYSDGTVISNDATETVKIIPDALFDLGTIIGKAFHDKNANGIQDKGEEPIGNVQIATEDGTIITADEDGKFHLPSIMPGRHLFRLDERSLPEGAQLTTDKVVITDITPGLLAKVNFGIKIPDSAVSGRLPFRIAQDRGSVKPRLNVSLFNDALVIKGSGLKDEAQFQIFTNYQFFIDKWVLEILDQDTKQVVKKFQGTKANIFEPIYWNGRDSRGKVIKAERNYIYKLRVIGANKKEDVTKERDIRVTAYAKQAFEGEEMPEKEIEYQRGQWISKEGRVNNLESNNILISGETVKISGGGYQGINVSSNQKIALEVFAPSQSEVEIILPRGQYDIQVLAAKAKTESEIAMEEAMNSLSPLSTGEVAFSARSFTKHIRVGDDYLFFVGMGDAKVGYTFNRGNIEPVKQDDKFNEGFWAEGKLAYYLKGKVKGKYLITSSLDTQRYKKELFKYIDPDKYYPVYGDASSINYDATNTQGPLYLLIEWDKSSVIWGNYNTQILDTEFAQFSRTLYGAKAHLESVSTTQFGEPRAKAVAFRAQAKQKSAHNEFVGTGGSLFYLKHKDIVEGSDKIKIEVRDKITGLVLTTEPMKEGIDYYINYPNGRITFWKSISYIAESSSIISGNLVDGNPVYVVADYEYEVNNKLDEATIGGRVQKSVTDYLSVAGTYIKEEQAMSAYELKGADVIAHLGKNIKLGAEYAQTKSETTGNFVSTDGGLTFTELPTLESAKGKAYGLKAEAHLFNNKLGLFGTYKWIGRNFSNIATTAQQGKEITSFGAAYDLTSKTRLSLSRDIQRLINDGNLQTQAQVGATKTDTTSVQLTHSFDVTNDRLKLTGEFRHQNVFDKKPQFESQTNTGENILAVKADYKLTKKVDVSLEQQAALSSALPDYRTTAGVVARAFDWLTLRGKETVGNLGTATGVGASATLKDKVEISADYTKENYITGEVGSTKSLTASTKLDEKTEIHSTYATTESLQNGKTTSFIYGSKQKINDTLRLSTDKTYATSKDNATVGTTYGLIREKDGRKIEGSLTRQYSQGAGAISNSNIFGLSGAINDKWAAQASFEKGSVQNLDATQTARYAGSLGLGFVNKNFKASTKMELRFDDSTDYTRQQLLYFASEGKVNPDTTIFTKANISETRNISQGSTLAKYKELVFGTAYRPVEFDWLNLLAKYTYLEDNAPVSQSDAHDIQAEKSHVLSGEAIFDLNAKWQLSQKLALRMSEEKVAGFDFTKSTTWLWINRINYNINKDWQVGAEYRILGQKQAQDQKHGALIELSRKIGDFIQVGVGYNFTAFNDELTHLSYKSQGPFARMTGKLYDRTPEEIELTRQKALEKKLAGILTEHVRQRFNKAGSKERENVLGLYRQAELAYALGELEEAEQKYGEILLIASRIEIEERVRLDVRVEDENEVNALYIRANKLHKDGRIKEAQELYLRCIDMIKGLESDGESNQGG